MYTLNSGDAGHGVFFTGLEHALLGLHHIHKAHGRRDHERGAQARFDLLRNAKESCRGVSNGEDGVRVVFGGVIHGGDGACGAVTRSGLDNKGLRYEAVRRPAEY